MPIFEQLEETAISLELLAGLMDEKRLLEIVFEKMETDPQFQELKAQADAGDKEAIAEIAEGKKQLENDVVEQYEAGRKLPEVYNRIFAAMGKLQWNYYQEMLKVGFNEDQAMKLVLMQDWKVQVKPESPFDGLMG